MTKYERDLNGIKNGTEDGIVILRERKAELEELRRKGCREKNGFRRECIAQEYQRRKEEYETLNELI